MVYILNVLATATYITMIALELMFLAAAIYRLFSQPANATYLSDRHLLYQTATGSPSVQSFL
jgi:hypothetical protein